MSLPSAWCWPYARELTPEQLVDNTLLAELEASGFVRKLWGD